MDWKRIGRLTFFGFAIQAPYFHVYLRWLDRVFPYAGWKGVLSKVYSDFFEKMIFGNRWDLIKL